MWSPEREKYHHQRSTIICSVHLHPLHPFEWSDRFCRHPVSLRVWNSAQPTYMHTQTGHYYALKINLLFSFRCFSFVGRRGRNQVVSLNRQGCVFQQVIQHELLHALGFNHEQTRSDRDQHVRILLQNVIPGQSHSTFAQLSENRVKIWLSCVGSPAGMEHNFRKIRTRNLGTPYDYNSVMHYGR